MAVHELQSDKGAGRWMNKRLQISYMLEGLIVASFVFLKAPGVRGHCLVDLAHDCFITGYRSTSKEKCNNVQLKLVWVRYVQLAESRKSSLAAHPNSYLPKVESPFRRHPSSPYSGLGVMPRR